MFKHQKLISEPIRVTKGVDELNRNITTYKVTIDDDMVRHAGTKVSMLGRFIIVQDYDRTRVYGLDKKEYFSGEYIKSISMTHDQKYLALAVKKHPSNGPTYIRLYNNTSFTPSLVMEKQYSSPRIVSIHAQNSSGNIAILVDLGLGNIEVIQVSED